MNEKVNLKKVILASIFIAIGFILPFLTGNNQQLGNAFALMHIPVLLAGLILGYKYGLVVGLITPVFRGLLLGVPPLMPIAITMMFELGAYGLLIGLFYKIFPKTDIYVQISLVLSMILGRLVWGLAAWLFYGLAGWTFNLNVFLTAGFVTALPGIVIQLILIPILFVRLRNSGTLERIEIDKNEEKQSTN